MAQPSTMLTAEQLNAATTTQKIAIKNVSSDNYRWFVATSNIEALSHNVVFDWIPNTDGSFYLKLTYGDENSYIQQGAVNDKISFGTIDNAAKLKAVEPSTANGTNGYTALNYNFTLAQGADGTKFVRFVLSDNSVWFNCQATGANPVYKNAGATGGSFINGSHKAYLPVSNAPVAGSNGFSFRFEDGMTTGIDNVNRESDNVETIYDLTGRRVEAITAPGIYIVNGNKVLVK